MDPQLLREQAALENRHWWFVARRRIIDGVVEGLGLPADARILEAGCGTDGNLPMLSRHGEVFAFDVSETARRLGINLAEIEVREPEGSVSLHRPVVVMPREGNVSFRKTGGWDVGSQRTVPGFEIVGMVGSRHGTPVPLRRKLHAAL